MPNDVNKLTPHKDGKRRKMKMTKLTAVALTSAGANPHADVTFFKTKDKPDNRTHDDDVKKRSFLASATDGHSHLIPIGEFERVRMAGETSWQDGHFHPFVINDDGSVEIGEADAHGHVLLANVSTTLKSLESDAVSDSVNKNAAGIGGGQEHTEDTIMPEDKNADNNAAPEVAALEKKLARAENLATLTDMQKVHFNSLEENNKEDFLLKSNEARNQDIAAAKDADAIVYKADNGAIYHKSDDPRLVTMAKERDADREDLKKERKANADLVYKNRATAELSNLPGTVETHIVLLKSIDLIEDDTERADALAALKAQNTSFAGALVEVGTNVVNKTQDSAVKKMDSLTKAYQKENNVEDYYEAYDKVGKIHPETLEKAMAG